MKFKKTLMLSFILLAILTIGAVSAADDAHTLAVDDIGDEQIVETPIDVDSAQDNNGTDEVVAAEEIDDLASDVDEVVAAEEIDNNGTAVGDEVIAASEDTDKLGDDVPDFNFKVKKTDVDVKDTKAELFSFDWSDVAIWGHNHMSFVIYNDKNISVNNFFQDECDDNVSVKLKDLKTWGPGTYSYTVAYLDQFDNPGITIATGAFIISSKDVPVDFIKINKKTITNRNDVVVTIRDPVKDLHGYVSVYAEIDGVSTRVFGKMMKAKRNTDVKIYAKDLKKLYDGVYYNIKVVYDRNTGKDYSKTGKVRFNKVYGARSTSITCSGMTITYKANKKLTAVLKDNKKNPVSGKLIVIKLKNKKITKSKTNYKGQVSYSLSRLAPGKYTFCFTFNGNNAYKKSYRFATVTVEKASVKLTAHKKTFKNSVKVKKYTVVLKSNRNKVIKNTKITLKINKKTFTAKTNSKGKATFKISNLDKKANFIAVVKFLGNKYYKNLTKKVKINVK